MVGKRIRTSPILLGSQGVPGFVLIITYGHTFATTALLNGVDVKTVSSMLGHYSAGFTLDTYTHVTAQMQQAAADKMGGFLENALPDEGASEPEPPRGKIILFERVG